MTERFPTIPDATSATTKSTGVVWMSLYIAPPMPTSMRAAVNLRDALAEIGTSSPTVEVETIDVILNPQRALKDRIIVTPTLMALHGIERPMMIGDLSDRILLRNFILAAILAASEAGAN
jgi:circadian clock protein KaiB